MLFFLFFFYIQYKCVSGTHSAKEDNDNEVYDFIGGQIIPPVDEEMHSVLGWLNF